MTDITYRHIVMIVDRSGSIKGVLSDMQQGYRQFVAEQAALPGVRTTASLYDFGNDVSNLHSFASLEEMTDYEIVPRGMTALLDAIGFAVTREGQKLAEMNEAERPGAVIVLIATDGEENSSRDYTHDQIRSMIERQQERYGWHFIFNGANQDAFAQAGSMGIPAAATMDYAATPQGTASSWGSSSAMISRASAGNGPYSYTDQERDAARG